MNRVVPPSADAEACDSASYDSLGLTIDTFLSPAETEYGGEPAEFALFTPMHYESGYAYPLLVWLHGEGGHEQELTRVMPHISTRNHVGVAPRGTVEDGHAFGWSQTREGIDAAADRVVECIEAASEKHNIHPERVFIAGYQSGGSMAVRVALEYPELFAGAASVEGSVPRRGGLLRNINRARRLPLLLAASLEDGDSGAAAFNDDLRLLHSAGFAMALRLYPGGDGLTTTMLSDIDAWVLDRVCNTQSICS